jgi:hypothetical protein
VKKNPDVVVESGVRNQSHKTPQERAAGWIESVKEFSNIPPLSDEAISRESIYSDHG